MQNLLVACGLKKYFPVQKGTIIQRKVDWVKAVDGVDFSLSPGETVSFIGESGCGKTTITKLILLLEKPNGGSILYNGLDILRASNSAIKNYRSKVQAVFQDPFSSMNPRMRVGQIIAEPLIENANLPKEEIEERVSILLKDVGIDPKSARLYPHEFSGGQRQRIAIARALSINPALLILDEPVSGLDVSIRAQILNMLTDLQDKNNYSCLFISHHLATVKYMRGRVGVMYLGKIMEFAEAEELFANPLYPYTKALISAALPAHPDVKRHEIILSGEVPSPVNIPLGCRFHPRCFEAKPKCFEEAPQLREVASGHWVACHNI